MTTHVSEERSRSRPREMKFYLNKMRKSSFLSYTYCRSDMGRVWMAGERLT